MSATPSLIDTIASICDEKKLEQIAVFKLKNPTFTDYTIVCSAVNPIQIKAVAFELQKASKDGRLTTGDALTSGSADSGWVIVEIPGVASVHIMLPSLRGYYDLDHVYALRTA